MWKFDKCIVCHEHHVYFMTQCTPRIVWYKLSSYFTQICAFGIWVQNWYFLKCTYLGGGNHTIGFNILFIKSYVSFKCVVFNHQKGEIESAFIPFVCFGDLDNNTFKGLTSLLSVEQEIQCDELTSIVYNDQWTKVQHKVK
jgi:hypothetical protein